MLKGILVIFHCIWFEIPWIIIVKNEQGVGWLFPTAAGETCHSATYSQANNNYQLHVGPHCFGVFQTVRRRLRIVSRNNLPKIQRPVTTKLAKSGRAIQNFSKKSGSRCNSILSLR